jgi:cytochrome P450
MPPISFVSAAALVVLGAAAWRSGRLLARSEARRVLRAQPGLAVAFGSATAVVIAGIVAVVRLSPLGLPAAGTAVGFVWVALAWRARDRFGRRLPPGSLGLAESLDALSDRDYYRRRAARFGPVFKTAQFHQPVVCVVDLARGRELLASDGLAAPPLPLSRAIPRGFLRYMAPEDYARYAPLFRAAFAESVLRASRERTAAAARRALRRLADECASAAGAGAEPRAAIDRFLLEAATAIYLGDRLGGGDLDRLVAFGRDATLATAVGRPSCRARAALAGFVDLVRARCAERGGGAGETTVWSEIVRRDPAAADDDTVLGNLFLTFEATRDSVAGMLRWAVRFLAAEPAWVERLHGEYAAHGAAGERGDDLAARIVVETLRLAQSEYVYRRLRAPLALDGYRIPRGWLLRVGVGECHRRNPPFADPDRFDPDRHLERRYGPDELAPFGLDQHACLGARLTLAVGRTFVAELAAGYALREVADGPPERGPRHWLHWAPSPRHRVELTSRV